MAEVIFTGPRPAHPFQQSLAVAGQEFGQGFGDVLEEEQMMRQAGERRRQLMEMLFGGRMQQPFSQQQPTSQQGRVRQPPGPPQPMQASPFRTIGDQFQPIVPPQAQRRDRAVEPALTGDVEQAIMGAAHRHGVDPESLKTIAMLESRGDPTAENTRGSGAAGLFQFMPGTAQEFGVQDPFDPVQSAEGAARMTARHQEALAQRLGRRPTTGELYLAHQQGLGGAQSLLDNPDRPAFEALAEAGGVDRDRALQRVRMNLPDEIQNEAESITAGEFADLWIGRADGHQEGQQDARAQAQASPFGAEAQSPFASPQIQQMRAPQMAQPETGQAQAPQMAQPRGPDPNEILRQLSDNPALLADDAAFETLMGQFSQQGGEPFTLSPGQIRFDAQGQPVAAAPTEGDRQEFVTLGAEEVQQLGLPQDAVVQVDARSGEIHMRYTPSADQDQRDRRINDMVAQGVDRDRAVRLADGLEDMIITDQGFARHVDRVDGTVSEVPLSAMGADTPTTAETAETAETVSGEGETPPDETLWQATERATGVASGVASGLARTIGQIPGVSVGQEAEAARSKIRLAGQELIRSMSINPRFPEGEMQRLERMSELDPSILDSPEAMRTRMRQLDRYLRTRLENAERDAQDRSLDEELRSNQRQNASAIRNFLPTLGVPQEPEARLGADTIRQMSVEEIGALDFEELSDDELEAARQRYHELE